MEDMKEPYVLEEKGRFEEILPLITDTGLTPALPPGDQLWAQSW